MLNLGRILDIDLDRGKWSQTPFPENLARKFLPGRGCNVLFLHRNVPAGADPLGPENVLIMSGGLLTGTTAPASSRLHVNALSPLTGLLGSSNVGGHFGPRLRTTGIQTLVLRGRAPKPTYLFIDGKHVQLIGAEDLWGLDTWETQRCIQDAHGDKRLSVMAIGPGGEHGARFACIISDKDHAAGRTGMGAVMGSKNLKAIVVRGRINGEKTAFSRQNHDAIRKYIAEMKNTPEFKTLTDYGGAGYVKWADDAGVLSTRNYRESHFEAVDEIDGRLLRKHLVRSKGCYQCPVLCKADLRIDGKEAVRPEFEPMLSLGSKCGLRDLETLVRLDNLCSRFGLDNISAGSAIAFAMDLFDRGILSRQDTDGLDLCWGNGASMEILIRQMAYQEGLGAILSTGVRRAAEIIGRGAERFAPHVKGLELSGFHPHPLMATALGYAISNRGADFCDIFATIEFKWNPDKISSVIEMPAREDVQTIHSKAPLVKRAMLTGFALDCLGICKIPSLCLVNDFDLKREARLTRDVTGLSMTPEMLFEIGERIANMERLFNYRHGNGVPRDRLPDMFFEKDYTPTGEPIPPHEWMEPMKQAYYEAMGWDAFGWPRKKTLERLGLLEEFPGLLNFQKAC
jgi:aldehyde:ferredoxin oxidoreductase